MTKQLESQNVACEVAQRMGNKSLILETTENFLHLPFGSLNELGMVTLTFLYAMKVHKLTELKCTMLKACLVHRA